MQEFKQERGDMIVKGALNYVGKSAKVGTVGWCFGGGQSMLAHLTCRKTGRCLCNLLWHAGGGRCELKDIEYGCAWNFRLP